jgi:hypothetical protein
MGHPAASVQRQHAPAVLANRLLLAHRWGQPCRAYNVGIWPSSTGAAALAALQASALRLEPSLLLVPEPALHANLAWLLPVHQEFDRPKDELWQQYGPRWIATLAEAAGKTGSFCLCYRHRRQRTACHPGTNLPIPGLRDPPQPAAGTRQPSPMTSNEFPVNDRSRLAVAGSAGGCWLGVHLASRRKPPASLVTEQSGNGRDAGQRQRCGNKYRPASQSCPDAVALREDEHILCCGQTSAHDHGEQLRRRQA